MQRYLQAHGLCQVRALLSVTHRVTITNIASLSDEYFQVSDMPRVVPRCNCASSARAVLLRLHAPSAASVRFAANATTRLQSVEVAYRKVFGVGELTWEWRPDVALRSHLHPLLFMAAYAPLRWAGVDTATLITLTPMLIHAALFAVADVFMARLLHRLFTRADAHGMQTAIDGYAAWMSG